jgi:hypothetical protein
MLLISIINKEASDSTSKDHLTNYLLDLTFLLIISLFTSP